MNAPALPALAVDGLGLQIGGARILAGCELRGRRRRNVGVIGPNGAGKTTCST